MSQELLNKAVAASLKSNLPEFRVGDTVSVSVRIVEGEKERVQAFRGIVIARKGSGISETFTVRRIVNNEGVERTFPVHSPSLVGIKVDRTGRTRRAKLYYLQDRVGKATRLRDIDLTDKPAGTNEAETSQPDEKTPTTEETQAGAETDSTEKTGEE